MEDTNRENDIFTCYADGTFSNGLVALNTELNDFHLSAKHEGGMIRNVRPMEIFVQTPPEHSSNNKRLAQQIKIVAIYDPQNRTRFLSLFPYRFLCCDHCMLFS